MYFFKRELYKITVIALTNIFLEFVSYVLYHTACFTVCTFVEQVNRFRRIDRSSYLVLSLFPLHSPLNFTRLQIGLSD